MFLEPILHNVDIGMQDENIRTDIDHIDYDISVFRQFKGQSVSSGQISYARLHTVMKNCFEFKHAIGKSLESRIPDLQFVLQNPSFLNPENRRHSKCNIEAVIQRFCK